MLTTREKWPIGVSWLWPFWVAGGTLAVNAATGNRYGPSLILLLIIAASGLPFVWASMFNLLIRRLPAGISAILALVGSLVLTSGEIVLAAYAYAIGMMSLFFPRC